MSARTKFEWGRPRRPQNSARSIDSLSPLSVLPPIDIPMLAGNIEHLIDCKRTIIHCVAAHADRIPNLLPHLTCTIAGLEELIAKLDYALATYNLPEKKVAK